MTDQAVLTPKQSRRKDAGIQAAVWMALWKADELHSLDINSIDVEVHNSIVILRGHVTIVSHRQLAEDLTTAVDGVISVKNEIVVDHESRDGSVHILIPNL